MAKRTVDRGPAAAATLDARRASHEHHAREPARRRTARPRDLLDPDTSIQQGLCVLQRRMGVIGAARAPGRRSTLDLVLLGVARRHVVRPPAAEPHVPQRVRSSILRQTAFATTGYSTTTIPASKLQHQQARTHQTRGHTSSVQHRARRTLEHAARAVGLLPHWRSVGLGAAQQVLDRQQLGRLPSSTLDHRMLQQQSLDY